MIKCDVHRPAQGVTYSSHPVAEDVATEVETFITVPETELEHMAVCQNLVPLVNIKIAGKWMFIPLKMVLIGIDPYPYWNYHGSRGVSWFRCPRLWDDDLRDSISSLIVWTRWIGGNYHQSVDVYPNMFIESYRHYEKHLLGLQPPNCCPKKIMRPKRPKQSKTASKSQAFMDLLAEKLKEALKRWDGMRVKNGMIQHDFIIHPVIHRFFLGYPHGISMVNDGYPAW